MPRGDGTGPLGKGPMTGRSDGFCVLVALKESPDQIKGFAGSEGKPVGKIDGNFETIRKVVINMPRGDGTGPAGMGPMTGRGAGSCAGYPGPGYANPVGGRGMGMGWGRGRGMGRGRGFGRGFGWPDAAGPYPANAFFGPTVTGEQELQGLRQQAKLMQDGLSQISERIEQLEQENKK